MQGIQLIDRRHAAVTSRYFPPVDEADPDGLLAYGGCLEPDWLLDAYSHGVFPWPQEGFEPMLWWSPDPRAIIELDGLHVSKRLRRTLRAGKFSVTCNRDFAGVLHGCATAPNRQGGTWLTDEMIAAYTEMHRLGHAHSVEVWHAGELAGGVYGMAIGGLFAAESMFHYETDASKVALAHLVNHLDAKGFSLLDIQQWTEHTGRMGAVEISRDAFLGRLQEAVAKPVEFGDQITSIV